MDETFIAVLFDGESNEYFMECARTLDKAKELAESNIAYSTDPNNEGSWVETKPGTEWTWSFENKHTQNFLNPIRIRRLLPT